MRDPITVSPVMLYYLGTQMKAKYIDYQYIASMPDIQKHYKLHKQETIEKLEKEGMLKEDLGGTIKINDDVIRTLTPVFFGKTESRIHGKKTFNVHVGDGQITVASMIFDSSGQKIEMISFFEADDTDLIFFLKKAGGSDISIQCADVEKGYHDACFSEEQIKDKEELAKAIRLVKGECEDGLL